MTKKQWISVYKPRSSKNYYVQVTDPKTKQVIGTRSTGQSNEREALKMSGAIAESILSEEVEEKIEVLTWSEFRDRYEEQVLTARRASTAANMASTMNRIEEVLSPRLLKQAAKASKMSEFNASLLADGLTLYSVKRHLSNARALFRWAYRMEYLDRAPYIPFPDPRDLERSKGRAITEEEFDRIVEVIPKVVGEERARDWTRLVRGLWLSGLRLGEALRLSWDDGDFVVDLNAELPRFRVRKSGEKSKRGGRYPITPDFFCFLIEEFQPEERTGLVFHASSKSKPELAYCTNNASRVIVGFGQRAGVKAGIGRKGATHFASAHDFRRSFGVRWAKRVDEEELRRLMRHSTIETTREFYTGHEEDDLAVSVWEKADREQLEALREIRS